MNRGASIRSASEWSCANQLLHVTRRQWIVLNKFSVRFVTSFTIQFIRSQLLLRGLTNIQLIEVMSTRRHLTTAQVLALIKNWSEENEPSEPDANDTSDGLKQDCSEHDDHNSESEQSESSASSDEDEDEDSSSTSLGKGEPHFVWHRRSPRTGRTRSHNILTQTSGPTDAARRPRMTFQKAFNCIFDDSMIDLIALYTNEYIASLQPQFAQTRNCRFTDREEIQALQVFFAQIIHRLKTFGRQMVQDVIWSVQSCLVNDFSSWAAFYDLIRELIVRSDAKLTKWQQ